MRITVERPSTGVAYFPGLAKPVVLDSKALPPAEAAELERLVEAAKLFDRPAGGLSATAEKATRGAADFGQQKITIESGGDVRTVHLSDLKAKSPEVQALLSFVQRKKP